MSSRSPSARNELAEPQLTRPKNTARRKLNRKRLLTQLRESAASQQWRLRVKFLYVTAFALFCVAAPVAAPAQSPDLSLMSALCSDDYYEDTAGQCGDISADGEIFIFTKYGIVITGDTDEDVIVLYLDDLEDTPVGSIQPRNDVTGDKPNAEPANGQETIASRVIVLEAPSAIGSEDADEVATTGATARSVPAAAEAVDDGKIE